MSRRDGVIKAPPGRRVMSMDESKFDYNYVPEHLKERKKNWRSLSVGERMELVSELSLAAWEKLGVVYDPSKPTDKTIRRGGTEEGLKFGNAAQVKRAPLAELKRGVVVRLKSGGPLMTVVDTAGGSLEDGQIRCQWFFRDALHSGVFHRDCLAPAGISESFGERLERLRKRSNEFNAQQDERSKDISQD